MYSYQQKKKKEHMRSVVGMGSIRIIYVLNHFHQKEKRKPCVLIVPNLTTNTALRITHKTGITSRNK